jgi:hypothetical protein
MLRVRRLVHRREDAGGEHRRPTVVDQAEHSVKIDVLVSCELGGELGREPGRGQPVPSPLNDFR